MSNYHIEATVNESMDEIKFFAAREDGTMATCIRYTQVNFAGSRVSLNGCEYRGSLSDACHEAMRQVKFEIESVEKNEKVIRPVAQSLGIPVRFEPLEDISTQRINEISEDVPNGRQVRKYET